MPTLKAMVFLAAAAAILASAALFIGPGTQKTPIRIEAEATRCADLPGQHCSVTCGSGLIGAGEGLCPVGELCCRPY